MDIKHLNLKALKKTPELGELALIFVSKDRLQSKTWTQVFSESLKIRIEKTLNRRQEALKVGEKLGVLGLEKAEADLWICVLPEEPSSFAGLGFAGECAKLISTKTRTLSLICLETKWEARLADWMGAAITVRTFLMPTYGKRAKEVKPFELSRVCLFASSKLEKEFSWGVLTAEATNTIRYLSSLPPNVLSTHTYPDYIHEYAKAEKLSVKFHSKAELKKMGAGAFTAVDRGDENSNGGIYELTYTPKKPKNKKWISLVGKGICFDTGGYDIKTQSYMIGMKGDMGGSALALAGIVMAAKCGWPLKMKAYLAVTENHVSPKAYRPDEVVIAMNGMSIEVINTDAEGRMILADALALASKAQPEMILDFATLTGAAHYAIGNAYSAVFSNREELYAKLVKAGRVSGERVWAFPMDKDFGKALESKIADIIQCTRARSPDHIMAAYFLSQFVDKDIDWVHMDLSSADREGGLAHVDSMFTGFGARWLAEFLRSEFLGKS